MSLYREHSCPSTSAEELLGERSKVASAEVGEIPLCLLTPDLQNGRITELCCERPAGLRITLKSNSMTFSTRARRARLTATLGLTIMVLEKTWCSKKRRAVERSRG